MKKCSYCSKPLRTPFQNSTGFCSRGCRNRADEESSRTQTKVDREAERLMQQYELGGWKPS